MTLKEVFSFGKDLWDPSQRFETSWILPPWILFACRTLISLYIFAVRFYIIGSTCADDCGPIGDEFSYFTILTYYGLGFYFLFAAIHTFTYARTGASLLDRFPRPLQALHSLLYTTIVIFPWLVTIVYWIILYDGTWFTVTKTAFSNVSQHALNAVFAFFEIVVPRTQSPPWIHTLWLVVILGMYLALAYVTEATKGFYPYSFLDPDADGSGWVAIYCVGILAGIIVVFLVVKGLMWGRKWVTEKKLGMDGRFAQQKVLAADSERSIGGKEKPPRPSHYNGTTHF